MSSRTTSKGAARERVAAMRAAEVRAQRRRRVLLAGGAVALVVTVVVALVVAKAAGLGSGGSGSSPKALSDRASARVVQDVTTVPAATLDTAGVGSAKVAPTAIKAPALTADGKPRVLYVGAEYCPYCAAERWPVVVALSRFGAWTSLGATTSSSSDVFPGTSSLSFHGATYTSPYLSFTGVETSKNTAVGGQYPPLDELSAADQKIFDTYDRPPYTSGSPGGIPFLDIGGTHVLAGAGYDPGLLQGKSQAQIARALADPATPVAQAVLGSANLLTATLCQQTRGQPAQVCTAPGVRAAAAATSASR